MIISACYYMAIATFTPRGITKIRGLAPVIFVLLATVTHCKGAEFTTTGGAFLFNATDYWYPNFYIETGFRGEVNYKPWANGSAFCLQFYGYPGDDNIFETIAEYNYHFVIPIRTWSFDVAPVGGLGVIKLQYPAPYWPTVSHQYLRWIRGGYDAAVRFPSIGRYTIAVGDRGRLIYFASGDYFVFQNNRFHWQFAPFGEVAIRVNDRWRLIGRGGCEWGGYYDDVFLPKEKKARPYGEVGFGLTL